VKTNIGTACNSVIIKQEAKILFRRRYHTALFGIAVQHADDGYSTSGNFGDALVHVTLVFTCYFICTTPACLCSQINDDDDDYDFNLFA